MNLSLFFSEPFYGVAIAGAIAFAITEVLKFLLRRFLDSFDSDSEQTPTAVQAISQQSDQVTGLQTELQYLRKKLKIAETRSLDSALFGRFRSTLPMGAYVGGLRHRRTRIAE
jgi:hypothetical protein